MHNCVANRQLGIIALAMYAGYFWGVDEEDALAAAQVVCEAGEMVPDYQELLARLFNELFEIDHDNN